MQNRKERIYKYALRVLQLLRRGWGVCEGGDVAAPGGTVYETAKWVAIRAS